MAEMRPAPLQLGIGSSVVLDGRTTGVREAWPASHRRQRYVHVAAAVSRRRRRGGGGLGGRLVGRSPRGASACGPRGTAGTARQRLGRRRRQKHTGGRGGQGRPPVAVMMPCRRLHRHRLRSPYTQPLTLCAVSLHIALCFNISI